MINGSNTTMYTVTCISYFNCLSNAWIWMACSRSQVYWCLVCRVPVDWNSVPGTQPLCIHIYGLLPRTLANTETFIDHTIKSTHRSNVPSNIMLLFSCDDSPISYIPYFVAYIHSASITVFFWSFLLKNTLWGPTQNKRVLRCHDVA